jgi:hypothetical protein
MDSAEQKKWEDQAVVVDEKKRDAELFFRKSVEKPSPNRASADHGVAVEAARGSVVIERNDVTPSPRRPPPPLSLSFLKGEHCFVD